MNDARPRGRIALLAHRAADPAPSGIGRYYAEIVSSLAARDAYGYALCTTREPTPIGWLPPSVKRLQFPGPRKAVAVAWALAAWPRTDRAFEYPDLLHALHPWTATPSRAPLITSIHDLMPLQHPDWYPRAEAWLYGRGIAHARAHAAMVIAHSGVAADELVTEAGIDRARIRVVNLAVGDEFRLRADASTVASVCRRHGVEPGRYVMAIGQVNDRKNLRVVLRALARVDPAALGRAALLVAGSPGSGADRVADEIARLGLDDRVRLAGYVPAEELPVLLGAARALVHPSRAEGFGFTPLEAMAAGVPALASNVGALPEMVGAAAELLDPDDVEGWAEAIEGIARDDARAADLIVRGTAHQDRFRWPRVAEDTERVYAEVLPPL